MIDSKFNQYKVDHLFLLMGKNPLPNYVAAKLLLNEEGTVYLIHTGQTDKQAKRLKKVLNDRTDKNYKSTNIKKIDLGSSAPNPGDIKKKITNRVKAANGRLGLNYTGGTKVMAVHAYRAFCNAENSDIVFSYLDSTNLKIQIEQSGHLLPLNIPLDVSLKTIFDLHGILLKEGEFKKKPILPAFAASLAHGKENWQLLEQDGLSSGKENLSLAQVKESGGFENIPELSKWIGGSWLEDYVLQQIIDISDTVGIGDYGMNFEILLGNNHETQGYRDKFEFDVAFMRHHQLFALSCTTSKDKKTCKHKLFEAHMRAKQMGGSEARVALVCKHKEPDLLKDELEVSVKDSKIAVFGASSWPKLSEELIDWITELDRKTV